jgi:integrase
VEKYLADWLDESLAVIGQDRKAVRDRHKHLTEEHGPHTANATMRSLRAVYRYERQVNAHIPECPVNSRDFNAEVRREKFVALSDLPAWKVKVDKMENPVRRDLQYFLLFTGMRRTAACEGRWEDFDESQRRLRVPRPKGGKVKAFNLPLSNFILKLLQRRREQNAVLFPDSHGSQTVPA